MVDNFACFFKSASFSKLTFFSKTFLKNTIKVSNSMDQDHESFQNKLHFKVK